MPDYSFQDRATIEAEALLWAVGELLDQSQHEGAWKEKIDGLRDAARDIAREMRNHNDQFENDES